LPTTRGRRCRRRPEFLAASRHDHPQGVVINPPPLPQQEVLVDLVSDDDDDDEFS
jgi:hypothetical protein